MRLALAVLHHVENCGMPYLKPIVMVHTRGFFAPLLTLLEPAVEERFMDRRHLDMWQVVARPEEVPGALAAAPAWGPEARSFAAV